MIGRVDAICKKIMSEHALMETWCRYLIKQNENGKFIKRVVLVPIAQSVLDDVIVLQELNKEAELAKHYAEHAPHYLQLHTHALMRESKIRIPRIYRRLRFLIFAEYWKYLALIDSLDTVNKIYWLIKSIEKNGIQIPIAENRPALMAYAVGSGILEWHNAEQSAMQVESPLRPTNSKKKEGSTDSDTGAPGLDVNPITVSSVDFCAIAPDVLTKGAYSLVNFVVYETGNEAVVDKIRSTYKVETTAAEQGSYEVGRDTVISVQIHSSEQDIMFHNTEVTHIWKGKKLVFQFLVYVSELYNGQQIPLELTVYFNGLKASELFLVANCDAKSGKELQISRKDILNAFASYSSRDRGEVMKRIQGMKKARPDLSIFCDVDSLRSGEDWQSRISEELDKRDVLFLFWSSNASKSKWVNYEWRYVYENKGIEYIDPVPLELPEVCGQPEELKSKHFSDRYLYYAKS